MLLIRILVSVTAVFSMACGKIEADSGRIHPDTVLYIAEFNLLAKTSTPRITIDFAELVPGEAARYVRGSEGYITVLINPSSWKYACPAQKRALIFHELGHAVLGRHHSDGITYMNTSLQSCNFYNINMIQLDAELFSSSN